ncbi:hypothetical protein BUALT_Bualt05G0082600 [Buddleja alternifolia]|uniref:Uncharacterized protein n=1 Tax=Buddleja alternifolia TaxID=168488 RepID=A0AAV6XQE2_9LAMI|nr:hypothetical protein BUALT_Bualt05G0082600 [Buddleja alternifolia]
MALVLPFFLLHPRSASTISSLLASASVVAPPPASVFLLPRTRKQWRTLLIELEDFRLIMKLQFGAEISASVVTLALYKAIYVNLKLSVITTYSFYTSLLNNSTVCHISCTNTLLLSGLMEPFTFVTKIEKELKEGSCYLGMDTKGRLVAGSHNRIEFVLINADEIGRALLMGRGWKDNMDIVNGRFGAMEAFVILMP